MEQKLNITEILKKKAPSTKLWSPLFGNVYCNFVGTNLVNVCHHKVSTKFYANAKLYDYDEAEPALFPSEEMRDWHRFAWERGDVLVSNDGGTEVIFDKWYDDTYTNFYCKHYLNSENKNKIVYYEDFLCTTERYSLQNKDSIQTYINTIEKRLGGKLNRKTLEIEKVQAEFKDGDILSCDEDTYTKHTTLILHKNGCVVETLVSLIRHRDLVESREPINEFLLSRLSYAREDEKKELFDALAKKGKVWDSVKK